MVTIIPTSEVHQIYLLCYIHIASYQYISIMSLIRFIQNYLKICFSVIVLIFGVYFRDSLLSSFNHLKNYSLEDGIKHCSNNEILYTESHLKKYNGNDNNSLYLSLMGTVFDVTKGKRHYEKGATYHYFIGHDGSRAFVTGEFKDRSANKDHVLDLACEDLFALNNWNENFSKKYPKVGLLEGRYFDKNCKRTEYAKQLTDKIIQCKIEKQKAQEQEIQYPPCNVEWSAEEGSRVWCTKTSGGISRSWEGVPRQMYTPGKKEPRCVCMKLQKVKPEGMFKSYKNCPASSTSCIISN